MYPPYKSTILILAVGILYFALAQVGYVFAMPATNISLLWLPSGLAMAAVVVIGYRAAGGILLGALLANYYVFPAAVVPSSLPSAFAIAMGNAGEGLLAAALFSRWLGSVGRQATVSHVLRFLCIAVTSTLPSALWRGLQLTGESATLPELLQGGVIWWWVSSSIGIIVGFPIFLSLYKIFFCKSKPNIFVQQMEFLSIFGLLSFAAYIYSLSAEFENLRLRFSQVAEAEFKRTEQSVNQILRVQSDLVVDISLQLLPRREEFLQHVQGALTGPFQTPGLFAISWNPIVIEADRAAFEQLAQQQGYENFSILERDSRGKLQVASDRPFYVPVFHIAPMEYNEGAIGFDLYSDPLRRSNIDEALRRNAPTLTAPVALLQSQTLGGIIIWPVRNPTSAAEASPAGFVGIVIRYDNQLFNTITGLVSDASVTVFDVTDQENATRVFVSDNELGLNQPEEASSRRPFLFSKTLVLGGRQLQLFAEPSPQFMAGNQRFGPLRVLLGCLLLGVVGTLVFTQHSRNQLVLQGLLSRTSKLINAAPDAIIAITGEGVVTEWNQSAVDLFGYSCEEAVGKRLSRLIIPGRFHHAHEQALLKNTAADKAYNIIDKKPEVIWKDASGIEFPVELSLTAVIFDDVVEYISAIRDLRPRKLNEEKRDEINRMNMIAQLTGGLAHDFNNLLGIVISNLEYLNQRDIPGDLAVHAQNGFDAAWRASQVTRSLMAIARREAVELRPVEINAFLAKLLPLIVTTAGKHIRLDTSLGTLPLHTHIDESGFTSAIINLTLNARDALERRTDGRIQIITREVLLPDDDTLLPPGRFACVSVSDNGYGIPKEILKHIVEPFYTTKKRGHGTGLGLAMVYSFTKGSNGSFKIESEDRKGTTASLYLPILESQELETKVHIDDSLDLSNLKIPRRVLVVDDEELLRRIASHIIAEMGFVVIQAASGDEALQVLRNEQVDILFSDISMPGSLDGIQLAKWVDSQLPEVSTVLTTGYVEYRRFERLLPSWQFLEKPYLREDLLRVLRLA